MQAQSTILDPAGKPTAITTREASLPSLDEEILNLLDPVTLDQDGQRALEAAGAYSDLKMKIVLRQTSVSQWVVFKGEGESARENVYPMGDAASAMFAFFGLHWSTPGASDSLYSAEVRSDDDGGKWVWVTSKLWRRNQYVCTAIGKRRVGFGYAKNLMDAEQCAFQNLMSRAARSVFGIGSRSREELKKLGIDLSAARIAEFRDNKSVTSSDPKEATLPFGKSRGKTVADAPDDELKWILPKIRESIEDPKKANFKAKNQALATAIEAELAVRAAKPAQSAEDAEALERAIVTLREEAAASGASEAKLKELDAKIPALTLAQAQKWIEQYRGKRKAMAEAKEPGADG